MEPLSECAESKSPPFTPHQFSLDLPWHFFCSPNPPTLGHPEAPRSFSEGVTSGACPRPKAVHFSLRGKPPDTPPPPPQPGKEARPGGNERQPTGLCLHTWNAAVWVSRCPASLLSPLWQLEILLPSPLQVFDTPRMGSRRCRCYRSDCTSSALCARARWGLCQVIPFYPSPLPLTETTEKPHSLHLLCGRYHPVYPGR